MNLKNDIRIKIIISISPIVVNSLSALRLSPADNSDLVQTSNSHVVNVYSPNFETATITTQNQSGVENSIANLFLNWLQSNGQTQGIQHTNASAALFQESIGLYGLNSNGNSYTFCYNVPFVAYGGIVGVTFSADASGVSNEFVSDHGNGNRVWFN